MLFCFASMKTFILKFTHQNIKLSFVHKNLCTLHVIQTSAYFTYYAEIFVRIKYYTEIYGRILHWTIHKNIKQQYVHLCAIYILKCVFQSYR